MRHHWIVEVNGLRWITKLTEHFANKTKDMLIERGLNAVVRYDKEGVIV